MGNLETSSFVTPPSGLPPISPARGEINLVLAVRDLPPCGGDVRQDRGGQRRAKVVPEWMQ